MDMPVSQQLCLWFGIHCFASWRRNVGVRTYCEGTFALQRIQETRHHERLYQTACHSRHGAQHPCAKHLASLDQLLDKALRAGLLSAAGAATVTGRPMEGGA
eukprot:365569-Chlamydomonas_euryale.AAC.22